MRAHAGTVMEDQMTANPPVYGDQERRHELARALLSRGIMTARCASTCLLLATTLFVPDAIAKASPALAREPARSAESSTPRALRRIVERHIAEARLAESVSAYTISPALVQLRRYVEPGRKLRMVCVVDLILSDRHGALLATVRGNATTVGATPHEALDAAAHAAVAGLPKALQTHP
ncbi:MAG TPA: hypothetical protein VJN18_29830 [Polyangiaceae bacterium]|nr:hypothetical protein [Polyangiaceae bacterium]